MVHLNNYSPIKLYQKAEVLRDIFELIMVGRSNEQTPCILLHKEIGSGQMGGLNLMKVCV